MRWKNRERSQNVQDRRGSRVPGGKGVRLGGGVAIVAVIGALLLGIDPTQVLSLLGGAGALTAPTTQAPAPPQNDEAAEFVAVILKSTEDVWDRAFGGRYQAPQLILFTDAVQSACGMQSAATGPFYCPADKQVYLDLGFLRELERLGAAGDFAVAYVIAHEVGHHVQNLLGTNDRVRALRGRLNRTESNALSVLVELQADCYAGIWANAAAAESGFLQEGDIEEGLGAAASIGDDRLQRRAGRQVQPESFTHGTSQQRTEWFTTGLRSGSESSCDSFAAAGIR